jgi:hypothetical protein
MITVVAFSQLARRAGLVSVVAVFDIRNHRSHISKSGLRGTSRAACSRERSTSRERLFFVTRVSPSRRPAAPRSPLRSLLMLASRSLRRDCSLLLPLNTAAFASRIKNHVGWTPGAISWIRGRAGAFGVFMRSLPFVRAAGGSSSSRPSRRSGRRCRAETDRVSRPTRRP